MNKLGVICGIAGLAGLIGEIVYTRNLMRKNREMRNWIDFTRVLLDKIDDELNRAELNRVELNTVEVDRVN